MVKTKPIKLKEKKIIVSTSKKARDQIKKEKDMIKLKKKINELIIKTSNDKNNYDANGSNNKNVNAYTNYQNMHQEYLDKEFSLKCISFINKISVNIKNNNLNVFEGKYNFNKIFTSLAKELLLNEFELTLLSLYLDKTNISLLLDYFTLEQSLLFLCFYIKNLTLNNEELEPINSYLKNEFKYFSENYEKWFEINTNILKEKQFTFKEINKRFREYNSPYNTYCSNNYIDFNYIVDRILSMSLPYTDFKIEKNKSAITNSSKLFNIKEVKFTKNKGINYNITNNNYFIDNNEIKYKKNAIFNISNNTNFNKINKKEDFNDYKNPNMKTESFNSYAKLNSNDYFDSLQKNNKDKNIVIKGTNEEILQKNKMITFTPNNLLHSLGNEYKLNKNSDNNYININSINANNLQNKNQSFSIYQQKPSLLEVNLFERNNSAYILDDDPLKQILRESSDNYFRSSLNKDSQNYPKINYINFENCEKNFFL